MYPVPSAPDILGSVSLPCREETDDLRFSDSPAELGTTTQQAIKARR